MTASVGLPTNSSAEEFDYLVEMAQTYVKNKNFDGATSLYLLPPASSPERRTEELSSIKEALTVLSREFGDVNGFVVNEEPVQWFEMIITGGDIDFLKKNSNFNQISYKTDFSKVGPGFIIFQVYENNGNQKLRGIGYALPENQDNVKVIQAIAGELMRAMKSRAEQ